jgi:transketolase
MLLYSILYLTGYDLPLEQLKSFRQWGSKTPGHPEFGHTPGVETTTGPLGQGSATAVGMAVAEAMLAARFNTAQSKVVDHFTYALVSDGDLMEGISAEACSRAGFLKLGKLIFLYDDNGITIEGSTGLTFASEDVQKRFEAYGWHTQKIDGHDQPAIAEAIRNARAETTRPSIVIAKTHIGFGSPNKQDTSDVHGSPLGEEELAKTKADLGWTAAPFEIPEEILSLFRKSGERSAEAHRPWEDAFDAWRKAEPEKASLWDSMMKRSLPDDLEKLFPKFEPGKSVSTRKASGETIQAFAAAIPHLVGGSADLAPSNNTFIKGSPAIQANDFSGRNFHFGIREHAMGGLLNGLSQHGGLTPFGATFLVFSIICAPRCAWPRSCNSRSSTSGRTTQSSWARMARRTNPWNTSPRCGRFPIWTSFALPTPPRFPMPGNTRFGGRPVPPP